MKSNEFERMIREFDIGFGANLPKRLEILAEGFARGWDADQVDRRLLEEECEALYIRSFFEASLIYAYNKGLSYPEWKELYDGCQAILAEEATAAAIFTGGKITLRELAEYVNSGSEEGLRTGFMTMRMVQDLSEKEDEAEFYAFMRDNSRNFSDAREKARYYFCKYLYYYIRMQCEAYYRACESTEKLRAEFGGKLPPGDRALQEKFALEGLNFLKPLTKLKKEAEKVKPGMSPEEKREYLETTSLTPGGIFDEFNYFYFGYISTEWVEVLFELYDDFAQWPLQDKLRIARSLGFCPAAATEAQEREALDRLAKLAKEERLREEALDQDGSRDASVRRKMYQRGRSGEDYFRDFILGKRDINRSSLISFLLFVDARCDLGVEDRITIPRLNGILRNCGMAQLRPGNAFDRFVMRFLKAADPMEVVEEEVEEQVTHGNDFYLYRVYRDAYCHKNELMKYLIG